MELNESCLQVLAMTHRKQLQNSEGGRIRLQRKFERCVVARMSPDWLASALGAGECEVRCCVGTSPLFFGPKFVDLLATLQTDAVSLFLKAVDFVVWIRRG